MKEKLLHTPEGVRDIYGSEFVKKFELQQTLFEVMNSYGYQGIETPTFEFFDVFYTFAIFSMSLVSFN